MRPLMLHTLRMPTTNLSRDVTRDAEVPKMPLRQLKNFVA